jgi:phage tail-like protein
MDSPLAPLLPAFRYWVLLKNSANTSAMSIGGALLAPAAGFSECSGLEITLETYDYIEGGVNGYTHRLPTRSKPTDIVLKRGLHVTTDLWVWMQQVTDGTYQRKDGVIVLCTPSGAPAQAWRFKRGLPLKWSGPSLAAGQSAVATESITIAHEGLDTLLLTGAESTPDAVGQRDLMR